MKYIIIPIVNIIVVIVVFTIILAREILHLIIFFKLVSSFRLKDLFPVTKDILNRKRIKEFFTEFIIKDE